MDALKSRSNAPILLQNIFMLKHILIIKNVCERLFDELVKEWLKNRYSIISGTFRVIDGRKVRVRKSQRWIYLTRNCRLGCQICNLLWFSKFRQDSYRLSKCQQNAEWGAISLGACTAIGQPRISLSTEVSPQSTLPWDSKIPKIFNHISFIYLDLHTI